jgi:hypothetical protein
MKIVVLCIVLSAALMFASISGSFERFERFSSERFSSERFSFDEVRESDTGRTIASVLGRSLTAAEAQLLGDRLAADPGNGRRIGGRNAAGVLRGRMPAGRLDPATVSAFKAVTGRDPEPAEMQYHTVRVAMISDLGRNPTDAEVQRQSARLTMDRGYDMRASLRMPVSTENEIDSAIMHTFKAVMDRGPTPAELHLNRQRIVYDPAFDIPALELALRTSPEFRRHTSLHKTMVVSEMDPIITEDQVLHQLRDREEPILPVHRYR